MDHSHGDKNDEIGHAVGGIGFGEEDDGNEDDGEDYEGNAEESGLQLAYGTFKVFHAISPNCDGEKAEGHVQENYEEAVVH